MADDDDASDILSVGTLTKDATLFFNQCENLMGSSRLQHTPSMMELPMSFIRDLVRERDEEYALYENKSDDDLYDNNNNRKHNPNKSNKNKSIHDDDDEEYEYYYEEEEYEDGKTNSNSNNNSKEDGSNDSPVEIINGNSKHNRNINIKRLNLKAEDSESVLDAQKSHYDSTPIVQPIIPPPAPPQSSGPLNVGWNIDGSRRRSGGITKSQQDLLKNSQLKPPSNSPQMSKLSSIDDAEIQHIFEGKYSDDEKDNDIKDTFDTSCDSDGSHTLSLDEELWNDELDTGEFQECNIRFEEDECLDGSKFQDASEFKSLQFFFKFVYDRFHSYSQFLLDTSLPTYPEWKKMRKVRIRNSSLKTVDYALKDCLLSVDIIKALVRNCIILCIDKTQPLKEIIFNKCLEPKISETKFNIGDFSILAAWDLFDNGSSPSMGNWTHALSINEGNAQKLSSFGPDLSHLQNIEMKKINKAYHNGKTYKFNIICEFLNCNDKYLKFGVGPIEWRLIKQKFIELHGIKYNNNILRAFDTFSYFINPQLGKLYELMNDKNDKYVSKRRVISEPIMWLYYMVSLLVKRQEKLQNLYITSMSYKADHNNTQKNNKLNALITNLAKQAKDESERLRAIMAKLPSTDDLKNTLIKLVKERDKNENKITEYSKSLDIYKF